MRNARFRWTAWLVLLVGLAALILLVGAGPGYQAGWFALGTALQRMLTWAAYAGIATVVLALVALALNLRAGGTTIVVALVALAAGLVAVAVPWRLQQAAQAVPRIHDITTDTITPPRFVEVAALRQRLNSPNSLEYTEEVALQQRAGYPDLAPAFLAMPPADAYRRALDTVRASGWEVVAADEAGGRIEATDTTYWFGFKDDVAVRVTAMPDGGSRVDVRSVSRVGRSDIGTNARRIRDYLSALTK
jgi:uncharacterized protein (DUF1499 family)